MSAFAVFWLTGCTKREGVQRHLLVGDRHTPGRPTSMKALRTFLILSRNAALRTMHQGDLPLRRKHRQHWVGDRGLTGGGLRSER